MNERMYELMIGYHVEVGSEQILESAIELGLVRAHNFKLA